MTHLRKFLYYLAQNNLFYRFCKRIVFYHRSENNCDIETNGELFTLKKILINKFPIVFDVGANRGDWTRTVLSINEKSLIHSFEPSKKTFEILAVSEFPVNVYLNNFGLGSKKGQQEFFSYGEDSTVNSLYARGDAVKSDRIAKEMVDIGTLDDYCLGHNIDKIDLLKIDVEGNELDVLRGAERMLKTGSIMAIQIEYGGTYIDAGILLRDVFHFINSCGNYTFFKIHFNSLEEVKYTKDLENFQYCNYLVVKK